MSDFNQSIIVFKTSIKHIIWKNEFINQQNEYLARHLSKILVMMTIIQRKNKSLTKTIMISWVYDI